jgi:hypothetical protein
MNIMVTAVYRLIRYQIQIGKDLAQCIEKYGRAVTDFVFKVGLADST